MRIVIHFGNLIEVAGAGLGLWGTYLIAGLAVTLLVACVMAVVAAELVFDDTVITLPLRRAKDDGVTTVRYK